VKPNWVPHGIVIHRSQPDASLLQSTRGCLVTIAFTTFRLSVHKAIVSFSALAPLCNGLIARILLAVRLKYHT